MKQKYLAISILTILIASSHLANAAQSNTVDQTTLSTQNPVTNSNSTKKPIQSKNAGGEIQTIVIDENGNLKVEDDNKKPQQSATNPAGPVTPAQVPAVTSTQPTTQVPVTPAPLPSGTNTNTLEQNNTAH